MKPLSDDVFNLIKSLSSQEKRAFKLFSKQNSTKTAYLKLFEAIDSLEQYDKKKLLLIFSKKGGIANFDFLKNYLHETLLGFLEYHYFDYSIEIQLQSTLHRSEILCEKGLFSSAKKCLAKAEKMAIDHHEYLYLLLVFSWKKRLMIRQPNPNIEAISEDADGVNEFHYMKLYKNVLEYQKINKRAMVLLGTHLKYVDKKRIAELNNLLKNPLLQDETKALSLPAKMIYFGTLGEVHLLLENWEKADIYLKRVTGCWEQANVLPTTKLLVLQRLMIALQGLNKSDEVIAVKNAAVQLVKSLPKKSATPRMYTMYIIVMTNYIDSQLSGLNIYEAAVACDEIQELVERHPNIQSSVGYYGNRIILSFLSSDYKKALFYCNKVLTIEKIVIQQGILLFIKMLSLVVHYELNNDELLPNLCQRYTRDFEKQTQENKATQVLLNFFGKTIHKAPEKNRIDSNKQERIKLFIALKKELEACKTDYLFTQFDFISWCDSKIENRPMIDILKKKAKALD